MKHDEELIAARLTAAQAREIAGPTLDEKIDMVLFDVAAAAKLKKRQLRVDGDLWAYGAYNDSADWKAAKATLVKLGYKVTFKYEERQFVDMYTLIEW